MAIASAGRLASAEAQAAAIAASATRLCLRRRFDRQLDARAEIGRVRAPPRAAMGRRESHKRAGVIGHPGERTREMRDRARPVPGGQADEALRVLRVHGEFGGEQTLTSRELPVEQGDGLRHIPHGEPHEAEEPVQAAPRKPGSIVAGD